MSDVPEGYKMSKMGVIPEEWEVKQLGEMAKITMGQSPKSVFYNINGDGLPLIQGNADIENRTTIIRTFTSSITKKGKNGDIIMSVRAPVGEIARATFDCCLGRGVCAVSYKNDYLYHYLIHFEKFWAKLSKGSTFDSINSKEVNELEIALPKLDEEQQAIASALNDVDALITALEQLITKKRNIKQGAMQQLLTGKKRLPGFSGEWEVKTLENITTEIGDGIHSTPQYILYSDFFFVNGNNLIDNSIKITDNTMCVSEIEYNRHKKKLNLLTILLSINGTIGNIAFFNDEKIILGKSAAYININNSVSRSFIFYLLQSSSIKNYFEDELTGSTIRNLSLKTIRNTPILLPAFPEQRAIAKILSDMDTEIESLKQKRNKYKAIKQGMMQELLTGKTRLL